MTTYRCTFDRIGRVHDVLPQDFVAEDAQALAPAGSFTITELSA